MECENVTIQVKTIEHVLSGGAGFNAVQADSNFESLDEFLKCEHSNESY